jgi:hypothetical protein
MKAEMISAAGTVCLLSITVLALPCHAQAQQPSLSDTFSWIDSTYNFHALDGGSAGHGLIEIDDHNGLPSRRNDSFSYNKCTIKIHHDIGSSLLTLFKTNDEIIDLSKIDPTTINVTLYNKIENVLTMPQCVQNSICDAATVDFSTINQQPMIVVDFTTHKENHSHSNLLVDDVDYAPRLAKAFRHAVELCGGKPSLF